MTRTFDLDNFEKPTLKLGDGVEYTLGDITESRRKKLAAIGARLETLDQESDDDQSAFIVGVCDLVDAACEAPGAGARVRELWDGERIGAIQLGGLVEFVTDWLTGQSSAGEA